MARSDKTAQEFIQTSFSPIVAVLSSPRVDNVVSKNNLSFIELLQPFTTLEAEGQFREPNGTVCIVKNLKLVIRDVNWKPLQPTEARRQLNNAVLHNYNEKTVSLEIDKRKFDLPQSTTWFDAWRETYLEVQFPSDHEFTKHFLSCMLVASTSEDNIIETFNTLNQQFAQLQHVTPPKLPKWFNSQVLKSYVLLHDASTVSKEKADSMFEAMKQSLETNSCFMLTINSRNTMDPMLTTDYWAPYIKRNDCNSEVTTPSSNFPVTPSDPLTLAASDENLNISTHAEVSHPLTSNENDVYDNANSLQTHSFSGSSESVNVTGRATDSFSEVHGAALNKADVDGLKKFIQTYIAKALLPYVERQITVLTEAVANRKGVSRSLLSATKRWFGKGGNTTGNSTVVYTSDCPELQLRRLGDLWFMCGQWQRAFDTYHTAKREFDADAAWLCYAGALEMAALSAFMAGDANKKTHGYMEECIVTYLNTCRMVQYAVRATLLSALCLSSAGIHGEAAKQLIRMTSEDSDLRSAMLLEQAALCFLAGPGNKAMCRKYAFHMVLAGHRFSKAGQKKHAYRCYTQAYQVYTGSGWRLATDHVQFALGRLAGALKRPLEAARWLAAPLAPSSPQPATQHAAFLKDYMLAHQQWVESCEGKELASLPLPLVDNNSTIVVCAGPAPLSAPGRVPASSVSLKDVNTSPMDNKYWHKMEEMLLLAAKGNAPMIFRPTVNLYTSKNDESPVVPQGEPFQMSITLHNPLKVTLVLNDIELLWRFLPSGVTSDSSIWLNNEPAIAAGVSTENNVIHGQRIPSLTLQGESSEVLIFSLTPLQVGQLVVHGLVYKLTNGSDTYESGKTTTIYGKVNFEVQLTGNQIEPVSTNIKCLQIKVIPSAPCLQMTFAETSPDVLSGELRCIDVEFRNVGPVNMKNLYVAVSHPDCVQLICGEDSPDNFRPLYEEKYKELPVQNEERMNRAAWSRTVAARHVNCVRVPQNGASVRAILLLRPRVSAARLLLLAYYEPEGEKAPHRLLRHVFQFNVTEAVELSATPRRGVGKLGSSVAEKMCLATEVKNVTDTKNSQLNIQVLEASLLSKQWQLTNLVAARDKNEFLASKEKMHFVLEATRIRQSLDETRINASSLKISPGNPDSQPGIQTIPYSKFVLEHKTPYIELDDIEARDRQGFIQSMLVVRWQARDKQGKTIIGQHCLWIDCFTQNTELNRSRDLSLEDITPRANKQKKTDVVLFKLEHDNCVKHNFQQQKICSIPVTINIVNCYEVPVKAFIDMSKKRDDTASVGWAGALGEGSNGELGVSVSLSKCEARRVSLRALTTAPGTYVLGSNFTVTSTDGKDDKLTTHRADNSTLLVVQAA